MVSIKYLILFFGFIILNCNTIYPQSNKEIKKQNSELNKLKNEISVLESNLSDKSEKEKESTEAFETISKQVLLLNKLINKIAKEERRKENLIHKLNSQIKVITKQITTLQKEYADYVVWIYKKNLKSDAAYMLESKSYNQALLRLKYLHLISESSKNIVEDLKDKTKKINSLKNRYNLEVKEKQKLVKSKQKEKELLNSKKVQKKKSIAKLKNDQEAITKEIENKRLSELVIKKIITKLTEDERKRQENLRLERLKNRNIAAKIDYSYDKFENFGNLKGKLNWPVASGKIVRKFGENRNEKLNTVTLNYGIDIETKNNIPVKAISSGRVSIIDWIPGYGSIIIITHKNNYRTVYGHLTDITVNKDDEIQAGQILGDVNESLEGNILHFEIWKKRIYQNPVKWLVKK